MLFSEDHVLEAPPRSSAPPMVTWPSTWNLWPRSRAEGPPVRPRARFVIEDPAATVDDYIEHRQARRRPSSLRSPTAHPPSPGS